jgi:hypothetical protein
MGYMSEYLQGESIDSKLILPNSVTTVLNLSCFLALISRKTME